ncbi:MAG: hypothetical protein CMO34_08105, partial [Verrucomicrobia bacterium]|nr:hypothetical protein [Verrucomicrobiota bacterium]
IQTSPFELYASASLGQTAREAINAFVHEFDFMENQTKESTLKIHPPDNHHREMEIKEISGFQQNAIRIGLPVIGKEHADYAALYYTNVLFGGFFGSRLMRNIREDKGYTYGIHSGIANNDHSSYFFINTEVGNEYVNDTLKEIKAELNLLKESEIHQDEIRLVRNYTLGSIMRGFDGAFNAMDRYRSLKKLNHDYSYYDNLIAEIRTIDSDKIRSVAKKYLNWEQMIKIVVGSKA